MKIRNVGIIGTGVMGTSIARLLASLRIKTTLVKWTKGSVSDKETAFRAALAKDLERGSITSSDIEEINAHLSWSDSPTILAECDLIIESIAEGKRVKRDCFRAIDAHIEPGAIVATNTSTLKIGVLAEALSNPERFIGLHFFNPVSKMALVEVSITSKTSTEVAAAALAFVERINKLAVQVKSSPGFIVNRLLVAQMLEAILMVFDAHESRRIADIVGVDTAMKKGANYPMGPFELMDYIGIDVVQAMVSNLYAGLKRPHFEPPVLLEHMVEWGFLGRKSGKGFYVYPSDRKQPPIPNAEIAALHLAGESAE